MLDVATELDLTLVPGFESELRCESKHLRVWGDGTREPTSTCTVTVTHLYRNCERDMLVCHARAADIQFDIDHGYPRSGCFNDCWKVVPV